MALVENFTPFFTDFASIATIGAASVSGLFDKGYAEAFDIAGNKPSLLCKVADLPALTLGTSTAVIAGVTYTIVENQPDGHGLTTLMLEAVEMANHVRQQIREAVATTLTGLATTGARVYQSRLRPLADAELPALRIYTDSEQINNAVTIGFPNRQERTLTVRIEAVVKTASNFDDTLDTIIKEVETALNASTSTYTAGGLARGGITLDRIEIDHDAETDKPAGIARMSFDALYFTASNAPDVAT